MRPGLSPKEIFYVKRNTRVMYEALSQPCVDCNITWHPLVMTFDHVDRSQKKHTIANIRAMRPKFFDLEVAKCEVVCRNCHQIREYLRDIGVLEIGAGKKNTYKYYERLVPYLCGGGIIRRDAYDFVPAGDI